MNLYISSSSSMKKFLRNLVIYLSLVIAITFGLNGLYGFNYEDFTGKYMCFNFALSSQSLLYDYKILLNYKDKIKNGAYVFIVISYFSLFGKTEAEEKNFESKNRRYYKFLPSSLIMNYDAKTDFYLNYLPVVLQSNILSIVKNLLFPPKEVINKWDKDTTPQEVKLDAEAAYTRHLVMNKTDENGMRIYNQEAFDSLYAMINLCRELGAYPILITTPFLSEYTDLITLREPKFFSEFNSVIDKIKHDTGVEYYDHSQDKRYCRDYSLFMDSDHMNRKGARKFTNDLLREVLGIVP